MKITRIKFFLLCLLIMAVMLSCNLPSIQTEQTPSTIDQNEISGSGDQKTPVSNQITEEADIDISTPTPEISTDILPKNETTNHFSFLGLDEKQVLVYLQKDGTLLFQRSDDTVNKVNTSIDIPFNELANFSDSEISFSSGNVAFLRKNEDVSVLISTDDRGVIEEISAPDATGELIEAKPSPDGSQIVWLFDQTQITDSAALEDCTVESDCPGREYLLMLTDGSGNHSSELLSYTGGPDRIRPELSLYQWKSDSKSIFLRWESRNLSAFYPTTGGGILEVTIPGGEIIEWKDDWSTDSIINTDGSMLATANDYDNGFALRLSGYTSDIFTIPVESNHLISQMTFSPSNEYLTWIETAWDDSMNISQLSLKALDISQQEVSTITELGLPEQKDDTINMNMPYTGAWLAENILCINTSSGSRLIDTSTGSWVMDYQSPESSQSMVLLDAILPEKNINGSLSETGPWLIFLTQNGFLWAMNEDGSSLTQLTHLPVVAPSDLDAAVSPDGKTLAFVTSTNPDRNASLTLNLLTLPGAAIEEITVLTSPESEPDASLWEDDAISPIGNKSFEATRAILVGNSIAWSPNGRTLAFVGAQNGPSSDLFTYSLTEKTFTRLSSGPSQAYNPSWSPDGNNIVHFGASTFGSGAGFEMVGAWVSPYDTAGSKELYDPSKTGSGEHLVGWLDNETFVVYSITGCPARDLRSVNIKSGLIRMLYSDCFWQVVLTPNGTMAVVNDQDMVDQPGLYILSPDRSDLFYISEGAGRDIKYIADPGLLLVQSVEEQLMVQSFALDGSLADYAGIGDMPEFSTDKNYWAWNETSGSNKILLKSSSNEYIIPLTDTPGIYPIWNQSEDPESQKLYFFSSNKNEANAMTLYMVSVPDFTIQPIKEKLAPASQPVWMGE